MKSVKLTKGMFALVDDDDYELVIRYRWHALKVYKTWYARGCVEGEIIYLHRFLLGLKPGEKGDHKDRNGLNNCRNNLRICTMSQNQGNRGINHGSKSGFKGVTRNKNTWIASIFDGGRSVYLGTSDDRVELAKKYDAAAIAKFGEFATTNKSLGLIP